MGPYVLFLVLGITLGVNAFYKEKPPKKCNSEDVPRFSLLNDVGDISGTANPLHPTGLGASLRFKDVLYFVNGGVVGGTKIYIINSVSATVVGSINLTDATNVNWADLTTGHCPPDVYAKSCIYVQDAGSDTVYVVPEPFHPNQQINTPAAKTLRFSYLEGTTVNTVNGIFVDCRGNVFFFDSPPNGLGVRVFQLVDIHGNTTAAPLFQMDFPSTRLSPISASMSSDCCELLVKTAENVYHIPVEDNRLKLEDRRVLPYVPNENEESVTFGFNNDKYFTVSSNTPFTLRSATRDLNIEEPKFTLGSSLGLVDYTKAAKGRFPVPTPFLSQVADINKFIALASSRRHRGFAYVASGDSLEKLLIVQLLQAQVVGAVDLQLPANYTFEACDMAPGRCPNALHAQSCVYINTLATHVFTNVTENMLLIVEEPRNLFASTVHPLPEKNVVRYSAIDNSTLWSVMVAPHTGAVFLMDTVPRLDNVTVYQLDTVPRLDNVTVYQLDMVSALASPVGSFVSHSNEVGPRAAAISPCGNEFLVKFPDSVFLFDKKTTVPAALQLEPSVVPYVPERDGQALDYASCKAYLTVGSDDKPVPLNIYRRLRPNYY